MKKIKVIHYKGNKRTTRAWLTIKEAWCGEKYKRFGNRRNRKDLHAGRKENHGSFRRGRGENSIRYRNEREIRPSAPPPRRGTAVGGAGIPEIHLTLLVRGREKSGDGIRKND